MQTSTPQVPQQTDLQRAFLACRTSFILVFIYSCGHNLLLLTPSIYLLQIYDRVLASRSVDTLVMLTFVVASAVLVDGVLDALRRMVLSRIGVWLEDRLLPSVLGASFEYALRCNNGTAGEACRDLATLRQFIGSPANVGLFDAPWAPLFLAVLFLVHPILGTIATVGTLLLLGLALVGEIATRAPLARASRAEAKIYQRLASSLRNVQAIRAMGMLDGAVRLVYRDVAEEKEPRELATRRSELVQALSKPVRGLIQVLIMGAAAWLVIQYHLSAGIIFASMLLLGRGLGPIEGLINSWKAFGSARDAYRRLTELLSATPGRSTRMMPLPRPAGALSIEAVSFAPPSSTSLVLRGISLRLAPGECLGIIGPSGAGKSTLGRMIAGVATPTTGRIRLDGADIDVWLDRGGARHIGYLPQEIELFDGSVKQNIARLGEADPDAVIEAAKLVGLHETIMQLPQAYDTEIGEAGIRLSGGQRQCLALARAFFGEPRLVVLDEPNASLDHVAEEALFDAIELKKLAGTTIIIITHRAGVLATTDKIAILQGGAISAFGESEEIFDKYIIKPQNETESTDQPPRATLSPPSVPLEDADAPERVGEEEEKKRAREGARRSRGGTGGERAEETGKVKS